MSDRTQTPGFGSRRATILAFCAVALLAAAVTVYGFSFLKSRLAPPADRSLAAVLPAAEWAHIFRPVPKVEVPITDVGPGADENPTMFALLKSARLGAAPPKDAPDLFINVRFLPKGAGQGLIAHYGYVSKTGLLGRDRDWAEVPPAFRAWVRKMDAKVPRQRYVIVGVEGGKAIAPVPESGSGH